MLWLANNWKLYAGNKCWPTRTLVRSISITLPWIVLHSYDGDETVLSQWYSNNRSSKYRIWHSGQGTLPGVWKTRLESPTARSAPVIPVPYCCPSPYLSETRKTRRTQSMFCIMAWPLNLKDNGKSIVDYALNVCVYMHTHGTNTFVYSLKSVDNFLLKCLFLTEARRLRSMLKMTRTR